MALGDTLEMAMSEHLRLISDLNKARSFIFLVANLDLSNPQACRSVKDKALDILAELDYHIAHTERRLQAESGG